MAIATNKRTTTPVEPEEVLIGLALENFTQGLIGDVDCEITDAVTCMFDYNGQQEATPTLAVEYTDLNGEKHVQYYGAGKAIDWRPSKNGAGFVPLTNKTGINNQTNLYKLLESLAALDFPQDEIAAGNLKCLIGTKVHVNQVPIKTTLVRTGKNADRPLTVLLVTKILALPGQKAPASTSVSAKKSSAAAGGKVNGAAKSAPAAEEFDLDGKIVEILMDKLSGGEPLAKKAAVSAVFTAFRADGDIAKHANAAVKRLAEAPFLSQVLAESGISYDGKASELSLG